MGRLTTHVLDTAAGRPAAGVPVTLWRGGAVVAEATTDAEGRAVLVEHALAPGGYELRFEVAPYFGGEGLWEEIPVRFAVHEEGTRLHVPLLVSPWSYATYRGS